jgi:hypothetical protein
MKVSSGWEKVAKFIQVDLLNVYNVNTGYGQKDNIFNEI